MRARHSAAKQASAVTQIVGFLDFFWSSFLLLSPMLLLGLFLAGLIHVFISRQATQRWLRHDSLKSVSTSAAIGVPMPLCSCSVVPVVAEMRRKGASRSSCMSFLITAPETGADSILVTNAFFGPIPALVRPVMSFITGVVAGIFCIGMIRGRDEARTAPSAAEHDHEHDDSCAHGHDHDHGHRPLRWGEDDCYVRPREFRAFFDAWLRRTVEGIGRVRSMTWIKPEFYREILSPSQDAPSPQEEKADQEQSDLTFTTVCKHILRYGFVEVADDILFALLVGLALGGVLFMVIPSDLMQYEHARWISYPIMVLVGVPLYICASASTPIAAALIAKGFSPGAAAIFLMTGPATNTGTIAIIMSQFGLRFASIYVGSVVAVTVVLGIIIDLALISLGVSLAVNLDASDSPAIMVVQWASALGLAALIVWRFRAGALKSGYQDLVSNVGPWFAPAKRWWLRMTGNAPLMGAIDPRRPAGIGVWLIAIAVFVLSGLTVVRPGEVGYGRLFGAVVWKDLQPGLHYLPPAPFARADKWPVLEVKSIASGETQEYLTGDLNLMSLAVSVQYRVSDPYTYHYRVDNPQQAIGDNVRRELRKFVSARTLDDLLNVERVALQDRIEDVFRGHVPEGDTEVLDAIDIVKVSLLSVSPIAAAMSAFREVSSSQEDRERIIVNAQRFLVSLIPRAHGNAAYELEQAKGDATRRTVISAAESDAIRVIAKAVGTAPEVLETMLWREKLESSLANKNKIIVPSDDTLNRVALWKSWNGAPETPHH